MLFFSRCHLGSVDLSFHDFAHSTGEADRTATVCVRSILALLVHGYHVSFSPALRDMPSLPAVTEDSQVFGLCFSARVFQHLLGNFVRTRRFFVLQGFRGFFKLLCAKRPVHIQVDLDHLGGSRFHHVLAASCCLVGIMMFPTCSSMKQFAAFFPVTVSWSF